MVKSIVVKVDSEFRKLIPALSAEEYAALEADIVRDGRATVPIMVWGNVLLDGHNRLAICKKHKLPQPKVEQVKGIKDRLDARIWIGRTQLGRRNLDVLTRVQVSDQVVGDEAKKRGKANMSKGGGDKRSAKAKSGFLKVKNPIEPVNGAKDVAKLANVGINSVINARKVLRDGTPELRAAVSRGDVATSTGALLSSMSVDEQRDVVAKGAKAQQQAAKLIRAKNTDARHAAVAAKAMAAVDAAPETATVQGCEAIEFIEEFVDQSVDLIVTDPPFSTDVTDIGEFATWLKCAISKIAPTGRAYVCCGAYPLELRAYLNVIAETEFATRSQILVWTYRNRIGPTPTYDYVQNWQAILYLWGEDAPPLASPSLNEQFAVQDINAPDGRLGDHWHAWQKPDELARRIITHASKPGDLVVDPFCGTGTFLLAAAKLGRKARGADNDPTMLDLAIERGCCRE
jgi:hypothetical protein